MSFIFLEHLVGLHIVTEILSEVLTVHVAGVWIDVLFQQLFDCLDCVFGLLLFFIPEYGCSDEELLEFIATDISLSGLLVFVKTHIGSDKQKIKSSQVDVLLV